MNGALICLFFSS
jgi:RNA exonuclease 1